MQSQVIICDTQILYAKGLSLLIQDNPHLQGYHIIQSIEAFNEFLVHQNEKSSLPIVLVIDSALLNVGRASTLHQIKELKPSISMMVVYNDIDDTHLFQLVESGISVIVSRTAAPQECAKALEMARQQKIYFCNRVADKVFTLMNHMDKIKLIEKVHQLHTYDKYILVRICEEASSKQIAYEVGHSKRTIEGHRTKMMQQLEVKNLAGLVKAAFMSKLYDHYLENPGLYDVTACAKTSSL
jgi:DNA-binding NarL/FixJ family response regulator